MHENSSKELETFLHKSVTFDIFLEAVEIVCVCFFSCQVAIDCGVCN